jgi:hypothetical protein
MTDFMTDSFNEVGDSRSICEDRKTEGTHGCDARGQSSFEKDQYPQ